MHSLHTAAAIIAYAATPAPVMFFSMNISVPGHSMAVKSPVKMHAINAGTGDRDSPAVR